MTSGKSRPPLGANPFEKPAPAPLGWVGNADPPSANTKANPDSLPPVRPDNKHRTMVSFPNDEFSTYAVLLAQVQAHHHVRVTFNDFLRLAALALRPKLEELAKANNPLTLTELYRALEN